MNRRSNQFSDGRRQQGPVVRQRDRSVGLPRLIVIGVIVAAAWLFWDRVDLDELYGFAMHLLSNKDAVSESPAVSRRPPPPLPRRSPPKSIAKVQPVLPALKPLVEQRVGKGELVEMEVSIGLGFRQVGFTIAAQSYPLQLSASPPRGLKHFPSMQQGKAWFGILKFSGKRGYALVLEEVANGFRLFLDRNRNGNLEDDGSPLTNQGKGLFAARVNLPIVQVTGIKSLQGDYRIWIFTNDSSWRKNSLRYYSMTQLQGRLLLKGKQYNAYLADNRRLDGDYRNDGIYIDINQDGKIQRDEHIAPNETRVIDGNRYRFRITR